MEDGDDERGIVGGERKHVVKYVYKLFWQKPTFGLIIVDSVDIKFTQMLVSAKKVYRRTIKRGSDNFWSADFVK